MVWSIFTVLCMGGVALVMINRAHFARTRRMALVPLGCVAVELLVAGVLDMGLVPVLTALLVILRAVIVVCCIATLRQDAAEARRRTRRRAAVRHTAPRRPVLTALDRSATDDGGHDPTGRRCA